MYRRRRLMRSNMMYADQQPHGGYGQQYPYGNGQPGYDQTNAQQQQYPPPQTQGYGGGYAPVRILIRYVLHLIEAIVFLPHQPAGQPPAHPGNYYPSPQSPPPAHYNVAQGKV